MDDIDISSPAGRKSSPAKQKPTSAQILSEVPRKEPDKTGGDPHTNWYDKPLSESETWKSHASRKPAKPAKK
jgi:hypothetical protein